MERQTTRQRRHGRASRTAICCLLGGLTAWAAAATAAPGSLIGRSVTTANGEELGRVHDFAVDLGSGEVRYVVVSVGSFLIDEAFIAVAPAALREDGEGLILLAERDSLRQVPRFAAGRWPEQAQVAAASVNDPDGNPMEAAVPRGSATISSGNRTATLADGERNIQFTEDPGAGPEPAAGISAAGPGAPTSAVRGTPRNQFERLDRDGDGVLDRAEIAHELFRSDSYADIDLDASGGIDEGEFDHMLLSRGSDG